MPGIPRLRPGAYDLDGLPRRCGDPRLLLTFFPVFAAPGDSNTLLLDLGDFRERALAIASFRVVASSFTCAATNATMLLRVVRDFFRTLITVERPAATCFELRALFFLFIFADPMPLAFAVSFGLKLTFCFFS